jgi:predicted amidophosphoribosyltransferase
MHCPSCGAAIEEVKRYCPSCGTELNQQVSSEGKSQFILHPRQASKRRLP